MNISDIVRPVEPEFLKTMTRSMKFFNSLPTPISLI